MSQQSLTKIAHLAKIALDHGKTFDEMFETLQEIVWIVKEES